MLDKVKSTYFLRVLFEHISEVRKLKLAKYSKYWQQNIDRRLIHYKTFSKRYIIYGPDGKGREYDAYNDKVIYEGEYLNGERNGKGKEFNWNGKFEGEYINGKRNGKGKEYDENGALIFTGEYFNGFRNGKGKEYYGSGELLFEGEYINNKRISYISLNHKEHPAKFNKKDDKCENEIRKCKVQEYDNNRRLIFEGEYLNGKRNGKGKEYHYFNRTIKYEGEYLDGEKEMGKEKNIMMMVN